MISSEQSFKCALVLLGGSALLPGEIKGPLRPVARGHPFTFRFWTPEGGELLLSSVWGPRLPSPSPCPPPVTISTAGSTPPLASFVREGREELGVLRPGRARPTRPRPRGLWPARAGVVGTRRPRLPGHQQLKPSWAAPLVKPGWGWGGAIGSFWPLPSEGPETWLSFVQLRFSFSAEGRRVYLVGC